MRKYILAAIAATCLILSSCGDIVNSEDNIHKTKQKYNSVKSDQEHGVIMPLKVGNKSFYQVTQFWSSGQIAYIYKDSIEVKSEVLINGEKWFLVHFPLFTKETDVYLTNTDLGLWLKCDYCDSTSYLFAQYPQTNSNMENGKFEFSTILNDGSLLKDSCQRYINTKIDKNQIGNYNNSLSYEHFLKLYNKNRQFLHFDCNFVENVGAVRYRKYVTNLMDPSSKTDINVLYELKKFDSTEIQITQNIFEYDFGQIALGDFRTLTKQNVLINDTDSVLEIMNTTFYGNCNIKVWLNPAKYLNSGDNLEVRIEITPKQIGDINGKVTIETNKGSFDILIKGTVI